MRNSARDHSDHQIYQRKPPGLVIWPMVAALSLMVTGWFGGVRVNLTASAPLGLWRVVLLDRQLAVGDVIFVCPPATPAMRDARARGYLRRGLCPADYAPLIKTVAGVEGQRVEIGTEVRIDGQSIASSRLLPADGRKRPLAPYGGGDIPAGYIFVHSDFFGSFDSRYFGPIPASGVLGLAQEVLTYAP